MKRFYQVLLVVCEELFMRTKYRRWQSLLIDKLVKKVGK